MHADNSPEAMVLFNGWLEVCRRDHLCCKKTISGALIDEETGLELLTQILDVGGNNATIVSLIEPKGMGDNYCSPSYYWGPPGTQTRLTTRNTLHDHLSGIKLDILPNTFQDAVAITRGIGLRHLWIDALCIVQGVHHVVMMVPPSRPQACPGATTKPS